MARLYSHSVSVQVDGLPITVGYGLFRRGETHYVRFMISPGKRVKLSLGPWRSAKERPEKTAEKVIRLFMGDFE